MSNTSGTIVFTDKAPAPIGPYSQAIICQGLVFTAGQVGMGTDGVLAEGGIAAQTRLAIANLQAVLAAAGAGLDSVLKTTVFLADMNDFAAFNQEYALFFAESRPARSTVQAARLPKDALVEIEAVAAVK